MTIITLRNLILSAVILHVMIFCVPAEADKICHLGNQVDEEGKMQWVSYDLPNDCDVILPGGFTERGLTKLNKIWTPEMVKFGTSFHKTTAMSDLTTPRSLLDEYTSTTVTEDSEADRVQSQVVTVSFNISCEAVADDTAYQPCDASLLSLLKGDAVACAATTYSANNEMREGCHMKLNLPGGTNHSFCTNDVKDNAVSLPMNISCNTTEKVSLDLPPCNKTVPLLASNDGDSMTCTTPCSEDDATVGQCPLRVVVHGW